MRLYHATSSGASHAVMRHGFVDRRYKLIQDGSVLEGVVLSDDPLAAAAGAPRDGVLLEVCLPDNIADLESYKVADIRIPTAYSVYCIPCSILNETGKTAALEYVDALIERSAELKFHNVITPELVSRTTTNNHSYTSIYTTRVSLATVLDMLSAGSSLEEILSDIPHAGRNELLSAIAFAADLVREHDALGAPP